MGQVNVHEGWEHDEESREKKLGRIIARVQYNANLDFFDGNNMTCGEMGRHLGITRLQDGRYVLIHGTQWQGERNWAEVVMDGEALDAIMRTGHSELLNEPKYAPLKELAESTLIEEMEVLPA